MTEEQRKEGILKQCKGLPRVVEKYIDFLIVKINKLVKENRRLAKHIVELQKDKGELTVEKKAEEYALKNKKNQGSSSFGDLSNYHDLRQGFIDGYRECEKEWQKKADYLKGKKES